jgi:hypothetical protein
MIDKQSLSKLAQLDPLSYPKSLRHLSLRGSRLHGKYKLPLKFVTKSPELSRSYQPGDPVRFIDWSYYARSDKLIVREAYEHSSAHIVILCFLHPNMLWPNQDVLDTIKIDAISKQETALRVAFNLLGVHTEGGDDVVVYFVVEDRLHELKVKNKRDVLESFNFLKKNNFIYDKYLEHLPSSGGAKSKCDLFYVVTDGLFYSHERMKSFFPMFRSGICLHVNSFLEEDPSWIESQSIYDPNSVDTREYRGSRLLSEDDYQKKLTAWKQKQKDYFKSKNINYFSFNDRSLIRDYLYTVYQQRST